MSIVGDEKVVAAMGHFAELTDKAKYVCEIIFFNMFFMFFLLNFS